MPDVTQIATRSLSDDETKISNIYVAIINAPDGTAALPSDRILEIYTGNVAQDVATPGKTMVYFTPTEDISAPCEVRVLANLNDNSIAQIEALKSNASATLQDWSNITQNIEHLYSTEANAGNITQARKFYPMYSNGWYLQEGLNQTTATTIRLKLSRSYARIDLVNSASNFSLQGATLLNGAKQGYAISSSTIPTNLGGTIEYKESVASTEVVSPIYIYPNSEKTYIIIHGTYTDPTGAVFEGYHKLAIKYKKDGETDYTYQTDPNTLYTLNIVEIGTAGYTSLEQAIAAVEETNGVWYEIEIGASAGADIVTNNGRYYLSTTNSECIIYGLPGALTNFSIAKIMYNKNSALADVVLPTPIVSATAGITVVEIGRAHV